MSIDNDKMTVYGENDKAEAIYKYFKMVNEGEISKKEASEILEKAIPDMSNSSIMMHLEILSRMVNGKIYKRTMNSSVAGYCIERIADDYSIDVLYNALKSVQGSIIYYFTKSNSKSTSLREMCQKTTEKYNIDIDFSDKIFDGIDGIKEENLWEPSIEEYNPNITVEQWRKFWNDKEIFTEALRTFFERLMLMGGTSTYSQIAEKFCSDAKEHKHFPDISSLGKRLSKRGECKLYNDDSSNGWAVPCFGRRIKKSIDGDMSGVFLFKLRDELVEALQQEGLQFGGVNIDIPVSGGSVMPKHPKNLILYGPPGTGKTYNVVNYAVAIIEGKTIEEVANTDRKEILAKYNEYKDKGQIEFCTFHQSFGYEEFIEGIKPKVDEAGNVLYNVEAGVFKDFCEKEVSDVPVNKVFIIDEINRGNISKIFGELITLIEDTKRIGADEEMRARLPYSGERFGVPQNVYLLGTMNTADRSIALIDTALRRRFKFVEMQPNAELLKDVEVEGVKIKELLEMINKRIEVLYDREHTIGHSFFMGLKNTSTIADLAEVFECNVIPLLKEYFYNDFERIAAVLGDDLNKNDVTVNFILRENDYVKIPNSEIEVPPAYKFNTSALKKLEAYKKIYE